MSIYINKNSGNTCYFTLTENSTLSNPYYLFNFVSLDSNQSIFFTGTDLSSNLSRYNKFTITETSGSTNFTAATISLSVGEWNYYAYEMTGQTNLHLSGTTSLVEQGLVFVSGITTPSTFTYTSSDDSETEIYFNN
jgi:hypothetical protein